MNLVHVLKYSLFILLMFLTRLSYYRKLIIRIMEKRQSNLAPPSTNINHINNIFNNDLHTNSSPHATSLHHNHSHNHNHNQIDCSFL